MNLLPSFLSSDLKLNGNAEDIFNKLYDIFKKDFINSKVFFNELFVDFDRRKIILKTEFKKDDLKLIIDKKIVKEVKRDKDYVYWNIDSTGILKAELLKLKKIDLSGILVLFKKFNKEEIFWHLIEKHSESYGDRVIDYATAKKLHWIKPIIVNNLYSDIINFDYFEGNGTVRKYLWLKNLDFVVILQPKPKYRKTILITAFYVSKGKRKDLESKYKKRRYAI